MRRMKREFRNNTSGGVATIFAISVVPMIMFVSAAITYGEHNAQASKAQAAIDAAALAAVTAFQTSGSTPTIQASIALATAQNFLSSQKYRVADIATNSTVSVDSAAQTVSVNYSSSVVTTFSSLVGALPLKLTGKAALGSGTGSNLTPVCILITDSSSGHTLLSRNTAKVDVYNCMVQVNTDDWDAVQADNTSYIHINTPNASGNWNCFVGDIHFGDILPAKQPSCALLTDPFSSYIIPSTSTTCSDSGATTINSGAKTLNPGTYCDNITISGSSNVTFSPGVYILSGSELSISGASNVTANGVVFILTGSAAAQVAASAPDAGLTLSTKSGKTTKAGKEAKTSGGPQIQISTTGTINLSPYTGSVNSQFAGFVIYQDQSLFPDSVTAHANSMTWQNATIRSSGVVYLADVQLNTKNLTWAHTGSLVADMFIPAGTSAISLTGDPAPVGAGLFKAAGAQAMTPQLIK